MDAVDSFVREHVVDAQQLGSSDFWCSLSWRPSVGMPGNTLAAASQEGEVMLLTQDDPTVEIA